MESILSIAVTALGIDNNRNMPIIQTMKPKPTANHQTTGKTIGDLNKPIADIPFDQWLIIWQSERLEKVLSLKSQNLTNEEIGKRIGVSRQIVGKILKMKEAKGLST